MASGNEHTAATEHPPTVPVTPSTPKEANLWRLAVNIAADLGADHEWTLIGGLMVQLHGFENSDRHRSTKDIDILGDARSRPAMTTFIAERLVEQGADMPIPSRESKRTGYRLHYQGEVVEVLGPDGLRRDPVTTNGLTTIQVAGGTQALARTEIVNLALPDGTSAPMRRPNLLGAILLKARAVGVRRAKKLESDRIDLIRLLSYVQDPRALAKIGKMKASERRWLSAVSHDLEFDDHGHLDLLGERAVERSRQAFELLKQS